METYLTEIKQLRIPRPKFEPNSCHQQHHHAVTAASTTPTSTPIQPPPPLHHRQWRHFVRPFTPPRDYHLPMMADGSMHDKM
ncbi:uncharacterized protein LOC128257000 [Drosophila gunungcola]|uniref:Uncharacterized protein n=1 Tax=Drosophila gunungcola TaxID=103775 RepID=A0A9P9YS71_9MUSC|nr:uncharacterized protein LOC128257000 [Drosophila gunungcola]KAI8041714.1 hypothetical protein M5D96_005981 [Drosophila gunungcola]